MRREIVGVEGDKRNKVRRAIAATGERRRTAGEVESERSAAASGMGMPGDARHHHLPAIVPQTQRTHTHTHTQ